MNTTTIERDTAHDLKEKADEAAKAKPRKKRPKRKPPSRAPGKQTGSHQARKTAAAVLEVLGGARTTTQAAEALGVSLPRYYVLESRALQGLVDACEPRPAGPPVRPGKQLEKLRKEAEKLRTESARYQALARATQRTVGLQPPKKTKSAKKKRRKKPTVRALKAAEGLLKGADASPPLTESDAAPKLPERAVTPA